jgi:hypothetical protein
MNKSMNRNYTNVVLLALMLGCSVLNAQLVPNLKVSKLTPTYVECDSYGTDWAYGDCAYNAVTIGQNGKIYFSISSHKGQQSAHVFEFDPKTQKVRTLWSVDRTVPPDGFVTQGKIHSFMGEKNGELYLVTHDAWYHQDHKDPATGIVQKPYQGGYVFAVDMNSGKGRVVSMPFPNRPSQLCNGKEIIPVAGEGMITGLFDPKSDNFYVLSWPSAIFAKINVTDGKVTEMGPMQQGAYTVPDKIKTKDGKEISNPKYEVTLRVLGLDSDGNIYGSRRSGEIWKYDPKTEKVSIMKSRMEEGTPKKMGPPSEELLNYWRTIVWDNQDKAFYGIHWSTTWLFKFDPNKDKVEPVTNWRARASLNEPSVAGRSQLSLAVGPDHRLYGFVHADPLKPHLKRSVHLVSYDLDKKKYKDHGVVTDGDSALMFAESCEVASNGDVYTVGWMEAKPGDKGAISKAGKSGPSETAEHSYKMCLVRVPAGSINKD